MTIQPIYSARATPSETKANQLFLEGYGHLRQGRRDQAILNLEEAAELGGPPRADLYLGAAYTHWNELPPSNRLDLAIRAFTRGLNKVPSHDKSLKFLFHYNRGVSYIEKDELNLLPLALNDLNSAVLLDPKYRPTYFHRGITYHTLGEARRTNKAPELPIDGDYKTLLHSALADYTVAIDANPANTNIYQLLGQLHLSLGDEKSAEAAFTEQFINSGLPV